MGLWSHVICIDKDLSVCHMTALSLGGLPDVELAWSLIQKGTVIPPYCPLQGNNIYQPCFLFLPAIISRSFFTTSYGAQGLQRLKPRHNNILKCTQRLVMEVGEFTPRLDHKACVHCPSHLWAKLMSDSHQRHLWYQSSGKPKERNPREKSMNVNV